MRAPPRVGIDHEMAAAVERHRAGDAERSHLHELCRAATAALASAGPGWAAAAVGSVVTGTALAGAAGDVLVFPGASSVSEKDRAERLEGVARVLGRALGPACRVSRDDCGRPSPLVRVVDGRTHTAVLVHLADSAEAVGDGQRRDESRSVALSSATAVRDAAVLVKAWARRVGAAWGAGGVHGRCLEDLCVRLAKRDSGLVATGALTLASDALRAIAKGIPTSLTHHASQHAIAHIKECAKDAGVDVKRAVMGGGPGSEGGAVGAFDFVFQVTCEAEGRPIPSIEAEVESLAAAHLGPRAVSVRAAAIPTIQNSTKGDDTSGDSYGGGGNDSDGGVRGVKRRKGPGGQASMQMPSESFTGIDDVPETRRKGKGTGGRRLASPPESAPDLAPEPRVVGVVVDPQRAFLAADKCMKQEEVPAFREMWGDRCELRHFPEGILHAVVWREGDGDTTVVADVVAFALSKMGAVVEEGGVEALLPPLSSSPSPHSDDITGVGWVREVGRFQAVMGRLAATPELPMRVHRVEGGKATRAATQLHPPRKHPLLLPHSNSNANRDASTPLPRAVHGLPVTVRVDAGSAMPSDGEERSHMLAALHLHVASVLGPEIPKGEAVASRDCVRVAWEGRVVEVEVVPGAGEEGERSAADLLAHATSTAVAHSPALAAACRMFKSWLGSDSLGAASMVAGVAAEAIVVDACKEMRERGRMGAGARGWVTALGQVAGWDSSTPLTLSCPTTHATPTPPAPIRGILPAAIPVIAQAAKEALARARAAVEPAWGVGLRVGDGRDVVVHPGAGTFEWAFVLQGVREGEDPHRSACRRARARPADLPPTAAHHRHLSRKLLIGTDIVESTVASLWGRYGRVAFFGRSVGVGGEAIGVGFWGEGAGVAGQPVAVADVLAGVAHALHGMVGGVVPWRALGVGGGDGM